MSDDLISWGDDGYGKPDRALYVGNIFAGSVDQITNGRNPELSWRAWIMTSDNGDEVGWYPTENEAQDALKTAVVHAVWSTRHD